MLGVRVPLGSRHFLSLRKLRSTFSQAHSFVSRNECCCPRTGNILNANLTTKIFMSTIVKYTGQQMYALNSSSCLSIRHESEGWRFEPPSGEDIFCPYKTSTLPQEHLKFIGSGTLLRVHRDGIFHFELSSPNIFYSPAYLAHFCVVDNL